MSRVLVTGFCSVPSPDRVGAQLRHVIGALLRHHQVDVLTLRQDEQAYVERVRSARILRVPMPDAPLNERVEAFRRALRRQLEGADYDIVHFRDGWSGLTVLDLKQRQQYATVFDVTRSPMAEPGLTDLATATELERAEESCVRRADLVLAPSEAARQFLVGLTDEAKVHVAPPGVNVDAFDWDQPPRSGPPIILYLGSLTPGRGIRVLLRAMYDVMAVSDAVLMLAGRASESFRASLEQAISDLSLTERVRLLGEVPHEAAPFLISQATVCVAPAAAELEPRPTALYPTKLLEYMACQRAVVAPRRGTVTMLLRDGQQGLLFDPGSPEDLARKLLQVISDSRLRERLARGGYDLVRRSYTASGARRSLCAAYGWLGQQESWRERLARRGDSDAQGMPTAEFGQSPVSAGAAREVPFGGDTAPWEDDSGLGALDGEEVTRVEVNPLAGGERMQAARREGTDEWVVESLRRDERVGHSLSDQASDVLFDSVAEHDTGTVVVPPLDNASVAGELLASIPRPDPSASLPKVMAMMPPLGTVIFESAANEAVSDEELSLDSALESLDVGTFSGSLDRAAAETTAGLAEASASAGRADPQSLVETSLLPRGALPPSPVPLVDEASKTRVVPRPVAPSDHDDDLAATAIRRSTDHEVTGHFAAPSPLRPRTVDTETGSDS